MYNGPYDIAEVGDGQYAFNRMLPPPESSKKIVQVPIVQKEYDDKEAARVLAEIGNAIAKTNQAMTNNFTAITARHNQEEAQKNDPRAAIVGVMGNGVVDPSYYTKEVFENRAAESPSAIILANDGAVITPTIHIEPDAWEKIYNTTGVRLPTVANVSHELGGALKDLFNGVKLPDLGNVATIAIVIGGIVVFATLKNALR